LEKEERQLKKQCFQLVQSEMKDAIANKAVHKLPDSHYKTKENYNLFSKRFITLLDSYFTLDQNNAYNFESLIIPLLKLEDEKRLELKMLEESEIESEMRNLKTVNEIIDCEKKAKAIQP
jgi:hypothetical protein